MRLPQDMANLLAVAVRDVIWFKTAVRSFLKECGVPRTLLDEIASTHKDVPTVKLIHHLLDRLDSFGEEGAQVVRAMLTKMHYWKDAHTIPADRKDVAMASLKALQQGYQQYEAQRKYQEEQERRTHAERVERVTMKPLDHAKLQAFRDEFDGVHAIQDPQERGNRFQDLMNRIFDYYCDESKGPFRRTGEQIDGLFYFDKHWHYVEVRWKTEKANAADVSVLRDRAKRAYGGDTKALFISFNGFTSDCLESLSGESDERVILTDGYDLRCVLDCQIAFDVLLAEKQLALVRDKKPFISAQEVIERRKRAS
ncbi:MAG: restriction endonuclease [Armatimonadetes bacterium]|nr:restriction endonuclease [Armatimonadota bacterium]